MNNSNLAVEKKNILNLFNQKKFTKILKISPKILSSFEDQPDIFKIVVISCLNTKNFLKAEQLLRKTLIKNNTAEYNYILGNTLKIQNKDEEAIISYKQSITLKCPRRQHGHSTASNLFNQYAVRCLWNRIF